MKLPIKHKHTLRYFISLSLLLTCSYLSAQEVIIQTKEEILPIDEPKQQTFEVTQRYGLRVGADLFRLTRSMYDKSYKGF